MLVLPRSVTRAAEVAAVCGAALLLPMAPATAVVSTFATATSVTFNSDAAADTINVTCSGGQLKLNSGADITPCNALQNITVNGDAGNDTIDLSLLTAADLPNLQIVQIAGGGDPDNIKGSFATDVIEADTTDTVQGFGGNDVITRGDSVFGGDGNDLLDQTQHSANGGAGDDRITQPGQGPFDGGEGDDTLDINFMEVPNQLNVNFVVTDTVLHLDVPGQPINVDIPSISIENYDFVLPPNGTHTWTSTAYHGSTILSGAPTGDTIATGPGDDRITARGGNDSINAGAGTDQVTGGTGDDSINVRDGQLDRVDCGDGTDSVVADFDDILSGCENVSLPQPVTGAIKGPKKVKQGVKAKFTFTSATPLATFQCKLDKKAWKACKSPYSVATKNLKASVDGTKHVLRVRAVRSGVVDATPSKKTFKVTTP